LINPNFRLDRRLASTIEVAVNGTAAEVESFMRQLAQILPSADVRPVRQIMEGEANVLNKTRPTPTASATLVILTSACASSPRLWEWSSTGGRLRYHESLGASEKPGQRILRGEAAAMGAVGAILALHRHRNAVWIGRATFHAPSVRASASSICVRRSVAWAISAILPIHYAATHPTAMILRGVGFVSGYRFSDYRNLLKETPL